LKLGSSIFIFGLMGALLFAPLSNVLAQEDALKPDLVPKIEKKKLQLTGIADKAVKKEGFFFFQNNQDTAEVFDPGEPKNTQPGWSLKGNTSFTPRSGPVLKGLGEEGGLNEKPSLGGFTPRNAGAELVLSYSPGDRNGDGKSKSLDIALTSQVRSQGADKITGLPNILDGAGFVPLSYNVDFTVGYSGFSLGASVKQDTGSYLNLIKGVDFGLGYKGRAWSTNLIVGGYSQKKSYLNGLYGSLEVNFYALEFGASYRLGSVFRLRGGVRYFDFYDHYGADPFGLTVPNKQVFYLGTHINF